MDSWEILYTVRSFEDVWIVKSWKQNWIQWFFYIKYAHLLFMQKKSSRNTQRHCMYRYVVCCLPHRAPTTTTHPPPPPATSPKPNKYTVWLLYSLLFFLEKYEERKVDKSNNKKNSLWLVIGSTSCMYT